MKLLLYFAFCAAFMVVSCASDKKKEVEKPPAHILTLDSMAFHLSQIHILDAALRHRDVRKMAMQLHAKKAFDDYFDTAGVTRERFEQSMAYWERDFEQMARIYDLSMEQLSTKLAQLKQNDLNKEELSDTVAKEDNSDLELKQGKRFENARLRKPKPVRKALDNSAPSQKEED